MSLLHLPAKAVVVLQGKASAASVEIFSLSSHNAVATPHQAEYASRDVDLVEFYQVLQEKEWRCHEASHQIVFSVRQRACLDQAQFHHPKLPGFVCELVPQDSTGN